MLKSLDFSDEYGENILYGAALLQGRVQYQKWGSRILCPDMPAVLRKVDAQVRRLPNWEEKCITMWYCCPPREDGRAYTKRDLAGFLGVSKAKFDANLRAGRRKLRRAMELF